MDLGLKDKVAIVTGGSKGIGRAVALALAREGVHISLTARGLEALNATAEDVRKCDVRVLVLQGDMGQPEDVRRVVTNTVEEFGHIDILVNNAASFPIGSFTELPDEAWLGHFNVKFFGYMRCIREVLPHMERQAWGRIINIAGSAARESGMVAMSSGPVNAAIVNFTKALAGQVARHNITVNSVHPGATRTDRHMMNTRRRMQDLNISFEEAEEQVIAGIPIGRLIQPEDISHLVLFLASETSSAITGQAMAVDGGAIKGVFY